MAINPITGGYALAAKGFQSGINAIYVGLFNDASAGLPQMTFTIGTTGLSASMITAVGGSTVSYFTVNQRKEQGSATEKTVTAENGGNYNEQTITITIEATDNVTTNWINTLIEGIWRVIVLDQNGVYWHYGHKRGMDVTAVDGGSGKTYGANGNIQVLTFSGKEPRKPYTIASSVALGLIS